MNIPCKREHNYILFMFQIEWIQDCISEIWSSVSSHLPTRSGLSFDLRRSATIFSNDLHVVNEAQWIFRSYSPPYRQIASYYALLLYVYIDECTSQFPTFSHTWVWPTNRIQEKAMKVAQGWFPCWGSFEHQEQASASRFHPQLQWCPHFAHRSSFHFACRSELFPCTPQTLFLFFPHTLNNGSQHCKVLFYLVFFKKMGTGSTFVSGRY